MTRRAAVLGSPVAHSLSPLIHNTGYAVLGLTDWVYTAIECRETELASFVDGLDESWAGLSLTMPLKEAALSVADEVSQTAAALGAANTLVLQQGRRLADNTDSPGMVDALASVGVTRAETAVVLGAGGTARAALGAVAALGVREVVLHARRAEAIQELVPVAERLGLTLNPSGWEDANRCGRADLVISTVPKGVADGLDVDWRPDTVLFDVLYDPWPTPLAAGARAAGCRVVSGLELLLAQAVRQFELFTDTTAPRDAMRSALMNRPETH